MNKTRNHQSAFDLYDDVEKIKDALRAATQDFKGKAREMLAQKLEDATAKTTETRKKVSRYVEEKPFKSLGLALLTGVIIGYILRK